MAVSPHHYINLLKKADITINKAQNIINMSKPINSPVEPCFSIICQELGTLRGELEMAISGLVKDSTKSDMYNDYLSKINQLIEELKQIELSH